MNINKNNLLVGNFAAKNDPTRAAIQNIHFTPEFTEATNGHYAVRITYPTQINVENTHESVPKGVLSELKPFMIPADAVKSIKECKPSKYIDWTSSIFLDVEKTNSNGSAHFYSTNLDESSSPAVKKYDNGVFPDSQAIFDNINNTPASFQICLDADYLKDIAEVASKIGLGINGAKPLCITLYDQNKGVRFETVTNSHNQKMDALLMPMHLHQDHWNRQPLKTKLYISKNNVISESGYYNIPELRELFTKYKCNAEAITFLVEMMEL